MILALLVGISGSGKSTFSGSLCKNPEFVYLSSDFMRGILGYSESDQSVNENVWNWILNTTEYFIKRKQSVVIDATNLTLHYRNKFWNIAKEYEAERVAYCFKIDLETAKKRNAGRERQVPEHIIDRQYKNLQFPSEEECKVVFVDNK